LIMLLNLLSFGWWAWSLGIFSRQRNLDLSILILHVALEFLLSGVRCMCTPSFPLTRCSSLQVRLIDSTRSLTRNLLIITIELQIIIFFPAHGHIILSQINLKEGSSPASIFPCQVLSEKEQGVRDLLPLWLTIP
jgi:hypothetical protein